MDSLKSLKLSHKFSFFSLQFYNKPELIAFCDAAEVTVLIFMLQSISLLVTSSDILRYPQVSSDIECRLPETHSQGFLRTNIFDGCLTSPHAERDTPSCHIHFATSGAIPSHLHYSHFMWAAGFNRVSTKMKGAALGGRDGRKRKHT